MLWQPRIHFPTGSPSGAGATVPLGVPGPLLPLRPLRTWLTPFSVPTAARPLAWVRLSPSTQSGCSRRVRARAQHSEQARPLAAEETPKRVPAAACARPQLRGSC